MKRFLIRSVLFALLVIGAIGFVCVAEIVAELRAYREELVAPDSARVVVCNDSQTGAAIDPEFDPVFFNFSAHGRALDQAYLTLIDILDRNGGDRLKTVVFDVSPASAVGSFTGPLDQMGYSGKYWLVHYLHHRESTRDFSGGLVVARDNLVGRRLRLFWRKVRGKKDFTSSLKGEFITTDIVDKRDCPMRYWGLLQAKACSAAEAGNLTATSPFATHVLDRVVALTRARGVRLVLMTTPWNRDLREACGEARLAVFSKAVADFAASRGCPYLDFLRLELAENEWGDGNHLNHAGARVFTRQLKAALQTIESVAQ